jgi:hypothetical protein
LKGKDIDLTIEGIAKVFKLPSTRTITRGKEGYNTTISKYFVGGQEEHYIPCSSYLIYKTNGPLKVMRLEVLTEILVIRQGNKYAFGALVVVIQVVEEGEMNVACTKVTKQDFGYAKEGM